MKCPRCNHEKSRVVDVRTHGSAVRRWRRRECKGCTFRFNTIELHAGRAGRLVPYDMAFNEAVNAAISSLRSLKKKEG